MVIKNIMKPVSPMGIAGDPFQQRLDRNSMVIEALRVEHVVLLTLCHRWGDTEFAVPDATVMGAEVANVRGRVKPRLQPVARQIELRRDRLFLGIEQIFEHGGDAAEWQQLEDHPARRLRRGVVFL